MKKETIKLETFLGEMKIEMPAKLKNSFILETFYEASESFPPNDDLPYEFVEEVSQRGDGSGYETFWVFKRKSDGKYFFYYSYDGRIEFHELEETGKEVISKWNFECSY